MEFKLKPGKYVVAVSGGVDSVVLLDLLAHNPKVNLIVAHFDHGIREDSTEDRKLVGRLAKKYNLTFEFAEGHLDPVASEAIAREARYKFLESIRQKYRADAIITAHHQDDLLETAVLNWLRGTGRKGLSSLGSTDAIKRPLLHLTKKDLLAYAKAYNLTWHEDSTNTDEKYLRNYVRQQIMPRLSPTERTGMLSIIERATGSNQTIDTELNQILVAQTHAQKLERKWFNLLPHSVAKEIMAAWLRQNDVELDRRLIERLVIAAKTYRPGKYADVNRSYRLKVSQNILSLQLFER